MDNLNPSPEYFEINKLDEIYVDKTGLISFLNTKISASDRYICVSRPRRFGKTYAANMISAYYSRAVNTKELFNGLQISSDPTYDEHINKYDVIFLNIQDFLDDSVTVGKMVIEIESKTSKEVIDSYPDATYMKPASLPQTLQDCYNANHIGFVFVIDEWDCIFRTMKNDTNSQQFYLKFLRRLLKDKIYVKLAYMTGILPIKKYETESMLNMFFEYTMENPFQLAEYVGFTEPEVKDLCKKYNMNFMQAKDWYDGFSFDQAKHIYSPLSVVAAMKHGQFNNYWNKSGTFENVRRYINLNFIGLKDAIVSLIAKGAMVIDTSGFVNDMSSFESVDDVLTLLVHLGYLSYNRDTLEVSIPNYEIMDEFRVAVNKSKWPGMTWNAMQSQELLKSTWAMDAAKVAEAIQEAHNDTVSVLQYNDENSLSCVVTHAYYQASSYYMILREFPSGKGFVDMFFLPKPNHMDMPALVIELKWNLSAKGAIEQIKERRYPSKLKGYTGKILLVGINYNKKSKEHVCVIEEFDITV
jgi:hypothetical protein